MKSTKILGTAATVAVAAMAFVGTGTASANTLCKVNENPCSAANRYSEPTEITAESSNVGITGFNFASMECHSQVVLKFSGQQPLAVQVSGLTWTNCNLAAGGGTTTSLPSGVLKTFGGGNGPLTLTSPTYVEFHNVWPYGLTCQLRLPLGATLSFNGGTIAGTAELSGKIPTELSEVCGKKGTLYADGELIPSPVESGLSEPYKIASVNGQTTGEVFVEEKP
jgi:hypothetical protein